MFTSKTPIFIKSCNKLFVKYEIETNIYCIVIVIISVSQYHAMVHDAWVVIDDENEW